MMDKEKLRITETEQEVETIKKLSVDIYSTHTDKIENLQTLLNAFKTSVNAQTKIDNIFDRVSAIKPYFENSLAANDQSAIFKLTQYDTKKHLRVTNIGYSNRNIDSKILFFLNFR